MKEVSTVLNCQKSLFSTCATKWHRWRIVDCPKKFFEVAYVSFYWPTLQNAECCKEWWKRCETYINVYLCCRCQSENDMS